MGKRREPTYGVPDEESPEMTIEDFRRARPVKEVFPEIIEAAKRARGRPRSATPKKHVSLRLDAKVVAAFKAQGPGWQGRINDVLARAIARGKTGRASRSGRRS